MIWLMCAAAQAALGPGPTTTLDTGFAGDTGTGFPGDTGDTGGTRPPDDTGAPPEPPDSGDTGDPHCAECTGAAGLAGEEGGSPCGTGPAPSPAWAALGVFALARRRGACVDPRRILAP